MKKIFLILLITSLSLIAQEKGGKSGISAMVQQGQFGIILPNWLTDNFALAPSISIQYASDIAADIAVSVSPRFYHQIKNTNVWSYWTANVGAVFSFPSNGATTIDYLFGPGFGAEYFFTDYFSAGVELQLNLAISDESSNRFGNPGGFNLNTASMLFVTIYFN